MTLCEHANTASSVRRQVCGHGVEAARRRWGADNLPEAVETPRPETASQERRHGNHGQSTQVCAGNRVHRGHSV